MEKWFNGIKGFEQSRIKSGKSDNFKSYSVSRKRPNLE